MPAAAEGAPVADVVEEALQAMAPDGVVVGARRIDPLDLDALLPEELDAVATARPHRREEFATGRVLLRLLLDTSAAIPRLPTRQPGLPTGAHASLAHDAELAVAVVSYDPSVLALGVDIEPHGELSPDEADLILRPDEDGIEPLLAFTMKEAAYKAWSTLGGELLDHHDVAVRVDVGGFVADVRSGTATLDGRYSSVAGRWLALVVVR